MGIAYVHFAIDHPSHYRVMFGRCVQEAAPDSELAREGAGAFQVLVDAIIAMQKDGLLRHDDAQALAQYIWANVHGIAMLTIDGLLCQPVDEVVRFAQARMMTGVATE
jgi:hypothetical protein